MAKLPASLHHQETPLTASELKRAARQLEDLQGNILMGFGRLHTGHLFVRFKPGKKREAHDWIKKVLKPRLTTAAKQLTAREEYRRTRKDGGAASSLFYTAEGYSYLGRDPAKLAADFNSGMKVRGRRLNDPPPSRWEIGFRGTIHAMIMIADSKEANVSFLVRELAVEMAGFADVVQTEFGNQLVNERNEGIEHFGYVDGRSQPLMLRELIDDEYEGTSLWNPAAGPSLVLVRDPFGRRGACGSYFVFRKLEQNVKAFKRREDQLAGKLKLKGEARELAGALVVGRFEDGTPVTLFDEPRIEESAPHNAGGSVPNNFDYRDDLDGRKCPLHAHIRKCNPRGTGSDGLKEDNARRMARRGITYGKRDEEREKRHGLPSGGVGLLFMAYQRSIEDQFEFIQRRWVNKPKFPNGHGTGADPVIGQGDAIAAMKWPKKWDKPASGKTEFGFHGFVKLKGGEYFFAPSLSGL